MMKAMGICLWMGILMITLMGCGGDLPAVSDTSAPVTTTTAATTTTLPQTQQPDTLSFTGRVLEVAEEDAAVLMECIGDCALGDRVWVQLGRFPDLKPQVGETYTVTYEDMVMLSLPPRIVAVTIQPAASK
jgi:hypothetical protein